MTKNGRTAAAEYEFLDEIDARWTNSDRILLIWLDKLH